MADAFALANAFVRIRPTSTGFRAEADSQLKAAMAGADQKVNVSANTSAAKAQAADLRTYLNNLAKKNYQFRLVADDKDTQARLTSLYGQLLRLDKTVASPKLTMQGLARVQASLLGIDAQTDRLSQKVSDVHVDIDDGDAERRLALLTAQVTALGAKTASVKIDVADPASEIILGTIVSRLAQIQDLSSKIDFRTDTAGLADAEQQLSELTADFMALTAVEDVAAAKTRSFGGLFSTIMKLLTTQVALFGGTLPGMLGEVAVWHIILDLLIEFAAVLAPAIIAMGVFGVVAIPTLKNIYTQMKNVHTVTVATGQALYPVAGGFQKLADAVQPSVYQLFGDALTLMSSKSGTLAGSLKQTGSVLDGFGARIAVALQSTNSSSFFKTANADLAKLGDELGNIFGIFGNLAKTMPGYAEVILGAFDSVTKSVENLTGSSVTQHILNWALSFHGAFLYTGLLATAFGKLATGGLTTVGNLLEKASFALSGFSGIGQKASVALGGLAEKAAGAAALPWTWIGVAAAGLAVMVVELINAKDATQQWFAELEKTLNAQNAVKGFTVLQNDQVAVTERLTIAQKNLTDVTAQFNKANAGGQEDTRFATLEQRTKNVAASFETAEIQSKDYQTALSTLTDQSVLYNSRLDKLAVAFGGVGQAQGILLASGVTMQQMLTGGTTEWLQIAQQVSATDAAYRAMGQTQGILGADMNVMNIAASAQVTQMGNLNKAFDTVIGIVDGGQGTFVTFEQALQATAKAAAAGGASMTGLSANSLSLRGAFQTSYADAAKMLDALRMMVSTTPNAQSGSFPVLTQSMKDTIAQLIPFGSQSAATQAELVSLAQEVNPNITNFQQLAKWVGNVKDPAKDLDAQFSTLGVNMQDLAKDASGLYASLQNDIINQFNLAKLSGSGASQAIKDLGSDVTHAGTAASTEIGHIGALAGDYHTMGINASDSSSLILSMVGHISLAGETASQKHASMVTLYNDFTNAGMSAKQAQSLVQDLTGELFKIPKNTPVTVTFHAAGSGTITFNENTKSGKSQGGLVFMSQGGKIPGYGGGDKHLAMLEAGETVVPKHLSGAVAPLMKKHNVPGFASGGIVGMESAMAAIPPWGAGVESTFGSAVTRDFAATVAAQAKADFAKDVAAANIAASAGPGGGAPAANAALARKLYAGQLTTDVWNAWNSVAMRESGWNQFARNASSGAYGIPQALPPTKLPFAGQAAGGSNPTAQINWMWQYMAGRYGGPIGAWQHEQSAGWYAKGTGGAAPGWGVVGEYGPELVNFHGGEAVLPHSATKKIISGGMGHHGYATGTPPTAAQKLKTARLKVLAADVAKAAKMTIARNKAIGNRNLGIAAQDLYDLQHPKDKNGPKKLAALRKSLTSYEASSAKPINLLHAEIRDLRLLVGEPKDAKYGGPGVAAATSSAGTSAAGTSSAGASAGSTSAAAQAAALAADQAKAAQEMKAFAQGILPSSGDTSPGGITFGSASGATASTRAGTATSGGGMAGTFPSAAVPHPLPTGTPVSSASPGETAMLDRLDRLIGAVRSTPGQYTAGMQAVMGGVARGARQSNRFNTRG